MPSPRPHLPSSTRSWTLSLTLREEDSVQFELVSFHPLPTSNRAVIPHVYRTDLGNMVLQQAYDRVRDLPNANLNRAQML